MNTIYFAFTLATTLQVIRILFFSQSPKEVLKTLDAKELMLEWGFTFILLCCFNYIVIYFKNYNYLLLILIGISLGSFLMSYSFFLYPFIILFRKNKYEKNEMYENWATEIFNRKVNVRIIDRNVPNAYATGILSLSHVILLSKPLIEKLNDVDVRNLMYHEFAHLKYNHLLIMYLSNLLCCSLSIVSASHFYPIFEKMSNTGLFVAIHGGVFGGLYILIPGLIQRRLEYQADKYAAEAVGPVSYVKTLINLNSITKGGLEKKQINYPTLTDRIRNVS